MRFAQILLGVMLAFFGATFLLEGRAIASTANGAPFCDDRAASAYAAEPAPQPIDSGDVAPAPESCKSSLASADPAAAPSHDDLQRSPELSADPAALIGAPVAVPMVVESGDAPPTLLDFGPADEHRLNDNPPPRPIPWRG